MVTTIGTSPSTGLKPDNDGENTCEKLLAVCNVVKCTARPAVGKFILNGTTNNHQTVQCKSCSTIYSVHNIRKLIHPAKTTQTTTKQPQPVKKTSAKELKAVAYAALKQENARFRSLNNK